MYSFSLSQVAGTVFRKTFEADPNLEFTFGWDKRNVYNQKVFGTVAAQVAVGYHYESSNCSKEPIWETMMTRMKGFDVPISDIGGGWNLEIHHFYNAHEGEISQRAGSVYIALHKHHIFFFSYHRYPAKGKW